MNKKPRGFQTVDDLRIFLSLCRLPDRKWKRWWDSFSLLYFKVTNTSEYTTSIFLPHFTSIVKWLFIIYYNIYIYINYIIYNAIFLATNAKSIDQNELYHSLPKTDYTTASHPITTIPTSSKSVRSRKSIEVYDQIVQTNDRRACESHNSNSAAWKLQEKETEHGPCTVRARPETGTRCPRTMPHRSLRVSRSASRKWRKQWYRFSYFRGLRPSS